MGADTSLLLTLPRKKNNAKDFPTPVEHIYTLPDYLIVMYRTTANETVISNKASFEILLIKDDEKIS